MPNILFYVLLLSLTSCADLLDDIRDLNSAFENQRDLDQDGSLAPQDRATEVEQDGPSGSIELDLDQNTAEIEEIRTFSSHSWVVKFKEPIAAESLAPENLQLSAGLTLHSLNVSEGKTDELRVEVAEMLLPKKVRMKIKGLVLGKRKMGNIVLHFVPQTKIMFLSQLSGNGNLASWGFPSENTGISLAHSLCQFEADQAGYKGTFLAWLSTSESGAGELSVGDSGGFLSPRAGLGILANTFQDLVESKLRMPVATLANGSLVDQPFTEGTKYFTGTKFDGTQSSQSRTDYCENWTLGSEDRRTRVGHTLSTGRAWTDRFDNDSCSSSHRLLCVQKGKGIDFPEAETSSEGKRIFVTSVKGTGKLSTWPGNLPIDVGPEAGDKVCRSRALAAGLSNPLAFKAWMVGGQVQAINRFFTVNQPYFNTRGIKVAESMFDLSQGFLSSGISYDEFGKAKDSYDTIFTGATTGGVKKGDTHCQNWTSENSGEISTKGQVGFMNRNWFESYFRPELERTCASPSSLICIED